MGGERTNGSARDGAVPDAGARGAMLGEAAGKQTLVEREHAGGERATREPGSASGGASAAPQANSVRAAFGLAAVPDRLWFPETEVGGVSEPVALTLLNQGSEPAQASAFQMLPYGMGEGAAQPGEFELADPADAKTLAPLEAINLRVVFRPRRPSLRIHGTLRVLGGERRHHTDVTLRGASGGKHAAHAGQGDEQTDDWHAAAAAQAAHELDGSAAPAVERYDDMLAAVLAARTLTDRARPGDPDVRARVERLLEPVATRLEQLDDHHSLGTFGAGNIAGQAALDAAHGAVRTWMRKLAVGSSVQTEMLLTEFQMCAETVRFLTGERKDAPTLRAFNRASAWTAIGAAGLLLGPAALALAGEEAGLLAYAGKLAAERVVLWALTNPAAALAASEALLGFGIQIGEDGWESFWNQLNDPRGCLFVVAQVLMDLMHVRGGMSGPIGGDEDGPPMPRLIPSGGTELPPDESAARARVRRFREVVKDVHDQAAAQDEPANASAAREKNETQPAGVATQTTGAPALNAQRSPPIIRGLSPLIPGEVYEGSESQVRDAFAIADASGEHWQRTQDPQTGIWHVTDGERTMEIHVLRDAPTIVRQPHATDPKPNYDHDAMNPGPLSDRSVHDPLGSGQRLPAQGFYGGKYDIVPLAEDKLFYRVGNAEREWGEWFTDEPIKSEANYRLDIAVKREWSDPRTGEMDAGSARSAKELELWCYTISVPKGTVVYEGQVGAQGDVFMGGLGAGQRQYYIPKPWTLQSKGAKVVAKAPFKVDGHIQPAPTSENGHD